MKIKYRKIVESIINKKKECSSNSKKKTKMKKTESEDLHADDNNLWSFRGNVFDHRMTQEQFNAFKSYIDELRYHTEYMSPQDEDYKKIKKELDDKYHDKLSFDPSKFTKTDMEVMLPEIKIVESAIKKSSKKESAGSRYLKLNARNSFYSAEDELSKTMNVGELVNFLGSNYDVEEPVLLCFDNGYSYGHIDETSFVEVEDDVEEEDEYED